MKLLILCLTRQREKAITYQVVKECFFQENKANNAEGTGRLMMWRVCVSKS